MILHALLYYNAFNIVKFNYIAHNENEKIYSHICEMSFLQKYTCIYAC